MLSLLSRTSSQTAQSKPVCIRDSSPKLSQSRTLSTGSILTQSSRTRSILSETLDYKSSGEVESASSLELGMQRTFTTSVEAAVHEAITRPSRDDPSIVRASNATELLVDWGAILESNTGCTEDYEKSRVVESIDYFLSHNWLVCRRSKFAALALFFNLRRAFVAVAVFAVVVLALYAIDVLPSDIEVARCDISAGNNSIYVGGVICQLVGPLIFYVTLLFSHEGCACTLKSSVFLDKTCIHQTNTQLQKQGIEALGAFITKSRAMLIIYAPIYFARLWTVYEMATYLTLQPDKPIVVLPTILPLVVFGGLPAMYLFSIAYRVAHSAAFTEWTGLGSTGLVASAMTGVIGVPSCLAICALIRLWARQRGQMQDAVRDFSISNAECSVPGDRAMVFKNVMYFMKFKELVPIDSSDEDVLRAFDNLVHRDIPKALNRCIGRVCVPYTHVLAVFMPTAMYLCDGLATSLNTQDPARSCSLAILTGIFKLGIMFPISVAFVSWVMHTHLQINASSRCEKVFVATVSSLTMTMLAFMENVWGILMFHAMSSNLVLCVVVGLGIILSVATYWLYRPFPVVKDITPLLVEAKQAEPQVVKERPLNFLVAANPEQIQTVELPVQEALTEGPAGTLKPSPQLGRGKTLISL